MKHPLDKFEYCPVCGAKMFEPHNEKAKKCVSCGFVYYFNPSAAVACFIRNKKGKLLLVRRAKEPAKGTLDLPGGFVDLSENAEEAACREVREETGLLITDCCYLFSLPNIYPYCDFEVHTVDLFFACSVDTFDSACAEDDASEIIILPPDKLHPDDFGLDSIKRGVQRYLASF